jgi:hypothetical protein
LNGNLVGDKRKVIERHREIARHLAERSPAEPDGVRCNFCRKGQKGVARMFAGSDAFICSECVLLLASDLGANAIVQKKYGFPSIGRYLHFLDFNQSRATRVTGPGWCSCLLMIAFFF